MTDTDGEETPKKLEILPGEDSTCVTCVFLNEDHTLGNSLRYVLMKKLIKMFIENILTLS